MALSTSESQRLLQSCTVDLTQCGNGIVEPNFCEECDDNNQNPFDNCTNECKNATCGDNIVW
jgi:cysteine-rich repeat protein